MTVVRGVSALLFMLLRAACQLVVLSMLALARR